MRLINKFLRIFNLTVVKRIQYKFHGNFVKKSQNTKELLVWNYTKKNEKILYRFK